MQDRRQFLSSVSSAAAAAALTDNAMADAGGPILSFGLMADCQYVNAPSRGTRHYRESPAKLREAVQELNRRRLPFTLHLGDFIDRDYNSFNDLEPIAADLKSKLHHALGNHDFDVADDHKSSVPRRLGLKEGYYSFQAGGFRFIVIDTTDFSVYRHPAGTDAHKAAGAELEKLAARGSAAAKPWNSRPGAEQIDWLAKELATAEARSEKALLFGHHPILPDAGHSVWNAAAMHELLKRFDCAKLYINGHNHAGHYAKTDGVHYLTLDGMVETRDTNAFAHAALYANRLEITGFDRQESRTLKFR